jgi:hypothetical protein
MTDINSATDVPIPTADHQPWVDCWPQWDEGLSKVTAAFDIVAARWKLALRFNSRLPEMPAAIREREIDRAWCQHRNGGAQ